MTTATSHDAHRRSILAYFGHHKCASTWIGAILARTLHEIGLRYYSFIDKLTPCDVGPLAEWRPDAVSFDREDIRHRADSVRADFVSCPTADRRQAEVLRPARAFHVIRDPRDLIVSAYYSHLASHSTDGLPHLQAHREALAGLSREDGLLLEMEFSRTELGQMGDWDYTTASILELKMEDLTLHPYEGFIRIFDHLGLLSEFEPVVAHAQLRMWAARMVNRLARRPGLSYLRRRIPASGELVLGSVYADRFEAQTKGRRQGVEDVASHYRKGIAGDWVNHFTPRHAEAFRALFGDLVIDLGYEESSDWANRLTRASTA